MAPPPENHPLLPPRPRPKPKPPKPKPPKPKPGTKTMKLEPVRDVLPFPPDPLACAAHCSEPCVHYHLCPPPPPSSTATVHLRSSRLPTPLIALSASVLAVSVVLLLVLLVCHVVRRRRRQSATLLPLPQPLNHQVDEEGHQVDMVPLPADDLDDGVHHAWYIRTVGLDERAIAAITALVYDPDKCRSLGLGGDGCAVCLAEFRHGETLRLLPRCGHAFHRGCIDTWLRAHVNCPLCRAAVKVAPHHDQTAASGNGTNPVAGAVAGSAATAVVSTERAVRRPASMVALPRLPEPDISLRPLASNSAREGGMGLAKMSGVLKMSEAPASG